MILQHDHFLQLYDGVAAFSQMDQLLCGMQQGSVICQLVGHIHAVLIYRQIQVLSFAIGEAGVFAPAPVRL